MEHYFSLYYYYNQLLKGKYFYEQSHERKEEKNFHTLIRGNIKVNLNWIQFLKVIDLLMYTHMLQF